MPQLKRFQRHCPALALALLLVAAGYGLGQWCAGISPAAHEATIPDAPAAEMPATLQLRLDAGIEAFGSSSPPAAHVR